MTTLSTQQIIDLARFAGLMIDDTQVDEFMRDSEYTIVVGDEAWCTDDDGNRVEYEAIAYCADCPEEGSIGLGPAVTPNAVVKPPPADTAR